MAPMMRRRRAVLAVAIAALLVVVATQLAQATVVDPDSRVANYGGTACTGTVEECIAGASGRRELAAGSGYIGYNVLRKDRTPCSIPGASYGNCSPGGAANPYNRGCSAIARCRG